MNQLLALCDFEGSQYLLFSGHTPNLIYYSHFTALILSLIIGVFVYFKDRKSLTNKILFWSFLPFLLWVFFNIIIWANNRSDLIMFLWSLQIMIEPLVYIGMLYLLYVFVSKKDLSFRVKLVAGLIYAPLIFITPTQYSLAGFLLSLCIPDENIFSYYTYVLELASVIAIAVYSYTKIKSEKDMHVRRQITFLSIGILLFLMLFASGNIFGSITDDWVTSQFGLFGTPIFAALIAYLIVKYKIFNVKLIATQALIAALAILVGAQFTFIKVPLNRILNGITLLGVIVFGTLLVRSVKREVVQREKLQKLTEELQTVNKKLKVADRMKTQFLSFASHQVKSPMAVVKDYAELIRDGGMGAVPDRVRETAEKIRESAVRLLELVGNLLDLRKLEEGKIEYRFENVDLAALVTSVTDDSKPLADAKHLTLTVEVPPSPVMIHADQEKIRQVIQNLIDNSVKYTDEGGWIKIKAKSEKGKVQVEVSDNGLGIPADLIPQLFEQFNRGSDAAKKIQGTGLGLYIAKQFMDAHHGRIAAESDGPGKGSTFTLELSSL